MGILERSWWLVWKSGLGKARLRRQIHGLRTGIASRAIRKETLDRGQYAEGAGKRIQQDVRKVTGIALVAILMFLLEGKRAFVVERKILKRLR